MSSDEELDSQWQPNGRRPQSTIARSFSQELMDIFRIENSLADLDEEVDKRKQQISSQTSELEALEARLREMESRLGRGSDNKKPAADDKTADAAKAAAGGPSAGSPRSPRPPVRGAFDGPPPPPPEKDSKYGGSASRPGTARPSQQAVPGALPPTPVASEDGDGERA